MTGDEVAQEKELKKEEVKGKLLEVIPNTVPEARAYVLCETAR